MYFFTAARGKMTEQILSLIFPSLIFHLNHIPLKKKWRYWREWVESHRWLTASSYMTIHSSIFSYIGNPYTLYLVHSEISLNMREIFQNIVSQCTTLILSLSHQYQDHYKLKHLFLVVKNVKSKPCRLLLTLLLCKVGVFCRPSPIRV